MNSSADTFEKSLFGAFSFAKAVIFSVVIGIVAIVQVKVTRKKEVEM